MKITNCLLMAVAMAIYWLAVSTIAFADGVDKSVTIKYYQPINELKIEVLWIPQTERNGYAMGPAIIVLTDQKHGISSTVTTNIFTLREEIASKFIEWVKIKNEDARVNRILRSEVILDYTNPEISEKEYEFGTMEEPFFFYDLNFDGKKEFIVCEAEAGQRWCPAFRAYELADSEYFVIDDRLEPITHREPYSLLDSLSTIDKENKTITIHCSNGAALSENHIYKLEDGPSHGKKVFKLKEVVKLGLSG